MGNEITEALESGKHICVLKMCRWRKGDKMSLCGQRRKI